MRRTRLPIVIFMKDKIRDKPSNQVNQALD